MKRRVWATLLAAILLAVSLPAQWAAADYDVIVRFEGWDGDSDQASEGRVSEGDRIWATFTVTNTLPRNERVVVTTRVTARGCQLTLEDERTEPIYLGPGESTGVVQDHTYVAGAGCNASPVDWSQSWTWNRVESLPPRTESPTPTPTPTPTPETTAANATPTTAEPTEVISRETNPGYERQSTLPWLLGFFGVLLTIVAIGTLVVAQQQRRGHD